MLLELAGQEHCLCQAGAADLVVECLQCPACLLDLEPGQRGEPVLCVRDSILARSGNRHDRYVWAAAV